MRLAHWALFYVLLSCLGLSVILLMLAISGFVLDPVPSAVLAILCIFNLWWSARACVEVGGGL